MKNKYYRGLYLISALYDFIIGFSFLFFPKKVFELTGMNFPNNPSYLMFCSFVVMFFGILLFMIYLNLEGSRRMVIFAILVKFSYVYTVLHFYFLVGKEYVDAPFLLFAVFDLIFALLFIESLRFIKK
jgi:hypothetical protein